MTTPKLIGSKASPFVRRVRIALGEYPFEFHQIQVFSDEGQVELSKHSPIRKIPLWVDGDNTIWDSLEIIQRVNKENISSKEKQRLILINEASDSGILLFQMKYFKVDRDLTSKISLNHIKRIKDILHYFEENLPKQWELTAISLFCLIDWLDFRKIYDWTSSNQLSQFREESRKQPFVEATDPRD